MNISFFELKSDYCVMQTECVFSHSIILVQLWPLNTSGFKNDSINTYSFEIFFLDNNQEWVHVHVKIQGILGSRCSQLPTKVNTCSFLNRSYLTWWCQSKNIYFKSAFKDYPWIFNFLKRALDIFVFVSCEQTRISIDCLYYILWQHNK